MASEEQLRSEIELLLPTDADRARWATFAPRSLLPARGDAPAVRAALAHIPRVTFTVLAGLEALVARGMLGEAWLDERVRERLCSPSEGADASPREWLVTLACDPAGVQTAERLMDEFAVRHAAWTRSEVTRAPHRWKVIAHDAAYVTYLKMPAEWALRNLPTLATTTAYLSAQNRTVGRVTDQISVALRTQTPEPAGEADRAMMAAPWRRKGDVPTVFRNELLGLLRDQHAFLRAARLGLRVGNPPPGVVPETAFADLPDFYEPLIGVWALGYAPALVNDRPALLAAQR